MAGVAAEAGTAEKAAEGLTEVQRGASMIGTPKVTSALQSMVMPAAGYGHASAAGRSEGIGRVRGTVPSSELPAIGSKMLDLWYDPQLS